MQRREPSRIVSIWDPLVMRVIEEKWLASGALPAHMYLDASVEKKWLS
jgi:hypothetical protein